jgi:hypothetical protein
MNPQSGGLYIYFGCIIIIKLNKIEANKRFMEKRLYYKVAKRHKTLKWLQHKYFVKTCYTKDFD